MARARTIRTVAVLGSMALILGAFTAAPAEAKKKKKKKPAVCAPYEPGELGKDAETTIVTDEATAEAPIELSVPTEAGVGFTSADEPNGGAGHPTYVRHNVQVDSAAPTAGLFVKVEFSPAFDYDLFLRLADGTSAAYSAGFFNQSSAEGGHSDIGYEQIDGAASADCQGYTVDIGSAITPGGDVTLKLWLGE